MNRHLVHIVNGILLLVLIGGSILVFNELPERIPGHMGLDGVVDRWEDRSWFGWLSLPLVGAGITLLTYIPVQFLGRFPHLINIPTKEKFADLSPERQAMVLRLIRTSLYWVNAATLFTFLLVHIGMYQAAFGRPSVGYTIAALVISFGLIPFISLALIIRVDAKVRATRPPVAR